MRPVSGASLSSPPLEDGSVAPWARGPVTSRGPVASWARGTRDPEASQPRGPPRGIPWPVAPSPRGDPSPGGIFNSASSTCDCSVLLGCVRLLFVYYYSFTGTHISHIISYHINPPQMETIGRSMPKGKRLRNFSQSEILREISIP